MPTVFWIWALSSLTLTPHSSWRLWPDRSQSPLAAETQSSSVMPCNSSLLTPTALRVRTCGSSASPSVASSRSCSISTSTTEQLLISPEGNDEVPVCCSYLKYTLEAWNFQGAWGLLCDAGSSEVVIYALSIVKITKLYIQTLFVCPNTSILLTSISLSYLSYITYISLLLFL